MKKYMLSFFLILFSGAVIILSFYFMIVTDVKGNEIICSAQIVEVNRKARHDLLLVFHVNTANQAGEAIIEGVITGSENDRSIINRQIEFTYTQEGHYFSMKSGTIKHIRGETVEDTVLLSRVPDFFVKEGSVASYVITPIKKYGYVFSVGKVPRFYCERQ
jgi:hypothetical protein